MKSRFWIAVLVMSAVPVVARKADVAGLMGFSSASAAKEREVEQRFLGMPSAQTVRGFFDKMTARPHHVGSPYDGELADWVEAQFKAWGLETQRHEYSVLMPYPKSSLIEIVEPEPTKLQVQEDVIQGDPSARVPLDPYNGVLPAYNAYSPAGEVTAEVVYVNYGVPADYDKLTELGIDVTGKIVLARYGESWRGIKPKVAAEHGALACIIYSDPQQDGYFRGDIYPDGPYRGWGMVQRGSVMDMPRYPGDPLTPGKPAKPGVERLKMEDVRTLSPIPVQPISYRDGLELLKRLKGPGVPHEWQGGLPLAYHIGPGPAKVHMKLDEDYQQRPLIDIIGTLKGSVSPDEWVIVGAHRDAWTFGAADNGSSHISTMDVARAFATMARTGWRPKRSVMFISWDGEEEGLLGSTEWVEDFAQQLRAKGVIYINRDGDGRGTFSASGVHSLRPFVYELAKAVKDPTGKTLYDGWLEREREEARRRARGSDSPPKPVDQPSLGALGSGSDYTAFLDHVGMSALNIGISGEDNGGTYHSIYDDAAWFRKFVDPTLEYNVTTSKVAGLALLRFADADVLPFDYTSYGAEIGQYVDEIEKLARDSLKDSGSQIDFARLRAGVKALSEAGAKVNERVAALLSGFGKSSPDDSRVGGTEAAYHAINAKLMAAERDLADDHGLPDRPWYRHTIYAPGFYTGYGVKTLPGIREAVEAKNVSRASEQAARVAEALERAARTLQAATATSDGK